MYTHSGGRGSKHEYVPSVHRIGIASYINVRVYRFSHGSTYSSMSCLSLGCSAFLRVSPTHIIFSFGSVSSHLNIAALSSDAAHPLKMVTLCPWSASVMKTLREKTAAVSLSVKLQKEFSPGLADDNELEDSDSDDEGEVFES
ncbi:hypothetical protein BV22DRAFT_933203 [Leucogyrophana mollusca]|uniref:Uncharacterized protein n=1 Tax=Leucogyrophana mollusca TaxID=85980 RepID=A0ACB8AX50_9AGAM|nr:hypothetical protein BV22DRAFT_933203 [Leucogyrophana mollusca]